MKNLLLFFNKYAYWILFVLLETIAGILYTTSNTYQRSTLLSSGNAIAGKIYSISGFIASFFYLHEENAELLRQNGRQEEEIRQLRQYIKNIQQAADEKQYQLIPFDTIEPEIKYESIVADVINNSVAKPYNYLTLNKGKADGIKPDMGVVSSAGIVGVTTIVSEHYSVVISVLNAKMRVSSKLKNDKFFGSLSWDTKDPRFAQLADLPRHATFVRGDTIITSGYSTIFPEGLIVGTIEDYSKQKDDNFYTLKIKLSTDFYALHQVRILLPQNHKERIEIEQKAMANDD